MNKNLFFIAALFILPACSSSSIPYFGGYQDQPLEPTSLMPNLDVMQGKRLNRVMIFNWDENGNKIASQANLGAAMAIDVENILAKNSLATVVDKKLLPGLEKEIASLEAKRVTFYQGPQIADYVIWGNINQANFASKYSSASARLNPDNSVTNIPAKFIYTATVSGNLKIYEMPTMAVVENFPLKGEKIRNDNLPDDNKITPLELVDVAGKEVKSLKRDDELVKKAGEEAINNVAADIKNFFASRGYILEKRVRKNKSIFKISVGKSDGVMPMDRFEITSQGQEDNLQNGKIELKRKIVATGRVSDHIDSNSAWVIIDNQKDAYNIRLGDMIKFKH